MKFKNDKIDSAKYTTKSIDKIIYEQENISNYNKFLLKEILKYFDTLFDRSLGTYKYSTVWLKLKPNVSLKYRKLYLIPLKYYDKVKEVNRFKKN